MKKYLVDVFNFKHGDGRALVAGILATFGAMGALVALVNLWMWSALVGFAATALVLGKAIRYVMSDGEVK